MSVIWGKPLRKTVHDLVSDYPALRSQINEMETDVEKLKYNGFKLVRFYSFAAAYKCNYTFAEIGDYIAGINNNPIFGVQHYGEEHFTYQNMISDILDIEAVTEYNTGYEFEGYVFRYYDNVTEHNKAFVLMANELARDIRLD